MRPRSTLSKSLGAVRLAPAHASTNLPSLSFQSLTNCPRSATHSEPLSFQPITNCSVCKSFVLILIQNAGGVGTPSPFRTINLSHIVRKQGRERLHDGSC